MTSSHNKGSTAAEQSGSKHQNAKMKGKLRPKTATMKNQHEGTSTSTNIKQDNNRGSPMALVKLYADMTDHQRQLIDDGFGGLLNCCCSQVFPELCQWLLDSYDPESAALVFPGRGSIAITEVIVHRVLGIPMGATTIKCEIDSAATSFMLAEFGFSKGSQPKISQLSDMLKKNRQANNKYLRNWTLLAACSIITPTFSTKVSPRLYPAVMDAAAIGSKNWCELVLRVLNECRQGGPKKHSFKPCLTLLQILYLDSLETGIRGISNRGCRVTVWSTNRVKKAIALDTKPDGSFGALKLKQEFSGQKNLFFGHPLNLDPFISNHVPDCFGPEERLNAKMVVQEMCTGFSKLVSKFIHSFYNSATDNRGGQQQGSDSNAFHLQDSEEEEEYEVSEEDGEDASEDGVKEAEQDVGDASEDDGEVEAEDDGERANSPIHGDNIPPKKKSRVYFQDLIYSDDEDIPVPLEMEIHNINNNNQQGNPESSSKIDNKNRGGNGASVVEKKEQGHAMEANLNTETLMDNQKEGESGTGMDNQNEGESATGTDNQKGAQHEENQHPMNDPTSALNNATSVKEQDLQDCVPETPPEGDEAIHEEDTTVADTLNSTQASVDSFISLGIATQLTQAVIDNGSGNFVSQSSNDKMDNDLELQLAQSISKLKNQKRKSAGQEEIREGKIVKVQGKKDEIDDNRTSCADPTVSRDEKTTTTEEADGTCMVGRILSFNCTELLCNKESESTLVHANTVSVGLKNKATNALSFEAPSFDLGISDQSSQENNNSQRVDPSTNAELKVKHRIHFRRTLQLPPHSHSNRRAIPQSCLAAQKQITDGKAAPDVHDVVTVDSQSQDDVDGNKHSPILVLSQSQEHGIPANLINVDSQSQNDQSQINIWSVEDEIPDDVLLMMDPEFQLQAAHHTKGDSVSKGATKEAPAVLNDGITPVPHACHHRVCKPATWKRSPFIDYNKKNAYNVSKSELERYNKISRFGNHCRSKKNSLTIVKYVDVHTTLGDFADSLKPRGQLSNETVDCVLSILREKMELQKRLVLTYRIATFAMAGQLDRREMKSTFSFANRLDHYNLIFFPALQVDQSDGFAHWFLIVLNLKAERFEVMDSIRGENNPDLLSKSNTIIQGIKSLWKLHHAESRVDISNYKLLYVDASKQSTTYDCGFYMIKYIEYWDGKTMPQIEQSDMHNIRIKFTTLMLCHKSNVSSWQQVLNN